MEVNHFNKHKYLEIVSNAINRMANNSMIYKGWTITILSIIGAVAVDKGNYKLFYTGLVPILGFYIADVYYLWLEQIFRELYKTACTLSEDEINYSMNIQPYKTKCPICKAIFSWSQIFYLILALISVGVAWLIN